LLEREGGLSAKDIGDDLRQTAPTLQNTEVVRALLRLMEEGRVSRVQGEETQGPRAMRYYKK
jgi:Fe2+ or Zn2+ uptake regulation protein